MSFVLYQFVFAQMTVACILQQINVLKQLGSAVFGLYRCSIGIFFAEFALCKALILSSKAVGIS